MRDLALLIKHPGRRKQLLDAALRDLNNVDYHFVSPVYEPMKPHVDWSRHIIIAQKNRDANVWGISRTKGSGKRGLENHSGVSPVKR